ncbi:MAG: hypothetical protein AB1664_12570 [Thermodesulfobacteriota bacterium]
MFRINIGRGLLLASAALIVWQLSSGWAAGQAPTAAPAAYQREVLATVGAIQGDAQVQRAGEAKFKKIAVKSPLYVMDFLATGKNSKIWWKGVFNAYSPSAGWQPAPEVTHGSLGADSVFGFKEFERAGASYRFVGYVMKGSVRFIKSLPKTDPPSSFIIGTHTAWIEVLPSDRAADFIVQSMNEALTTVTVLWGKVRVRNVSPETKEFRVLTSCQEVDVERDKEPSEIRWVSTDTMTKLVKRTTIPKTLPEDVPACERLKTEVILNVADVFLPPAGVVLFPVVPIPPREPKDKECCPPGQIYDPRTGECRCPCEDRGRPVTLASVGTGQCEPCRNGARYNPQTCQCECPCPPGQYLLPGQGCVPQCPPGFIPSYDVSSAAPQRCPVCQGQDSTVPLPPIQPCQTNEQCGRCEVCRDNSCVPRICPDGQYLDRQSCECRPATNFISRQCEADTQCSSCQRCVNGVCQSQMTCPERQRLNLATCQCEPLPTNGITTLTTVPTGELEGCQSNRDCPKGQICRGGNCVKRPPRREEPPEEISEPLIQDPSEEPIVITPFPGGTGFGIGIGPGGPGRGVAPPRQRVRPAKPN